MIGMRLPNRGGNTGRPKEKERQAQGERLRERERDRDSLKRENREKKVQIERKRGTKRQKYRERSKERQRMASPILLKRNQSFSVFIIHTWDIQQTWCTSVQNLLGVWRHPGGTMTWGHPCRVSNIFALNPPLKFSLFFAFFRFFSHFFRFFRFFINWFRNEVGGSKFQVLCDFWRVWAMGITILKKF